MKKFISQFLCLLVIFQCLVFADQTHIQASTQLDKTSEREPADTCSSNIQIKHGILEKNEIWSGTVRVIGDVVVPKGLTLEIKDNTVLFYEKSDIKNYGDNPDIPELVINGTLIKGNIYSSEQGYTMIPRDKAIKEIRIVPYSVDTKILRDEFSAFKLQYAVIWTLLGLGLIYTVANR
ncbi:hypothetical protein ACFL96_16600 [Thermoproteota archaeon]